MATVRDVRLLLARYTECQGVACQGHVEDVLMVVVRETRSTYELELTHQLAPCRVWRRAVQITRCRRIPNAIPDRGSRGSARRSRCRLSLSLRPSRRSAGSPCHVSD